MEAFKYCSQVEWMRERARTTPQTQPPEATGRMINDFELLLSIETNIAEVKREYPDYPIDVQRLYAEKRTFGYYWGMDNISQFPRPMGELPKKSSTNPAASGRNLPQLSLNTPALQSTRRGPQELAISRSTPASNPALPSPQILSHSLSRRPTPRRLKNLDRPPQDGWDADTGFPKGAFVFRHLQAYPHMWGKGQSLLQQLNRRFRHLRIRLERTPDKKTIVLWVEVKGHSGREGQAEKEGALNGLREYHKYDTGELGELPWIGTFYHENRHLFHPGHCYYRFTDNRSRSSIVMNREHYHPSDNRSQSPTGMERDLAEPKKPGFDQNPNPILIPIGSKGDVAMKREMSLDELIQLNKLQTNPSSMKRQKISLTIRLKPKEEVRGRGASKYYDKLKREYDEEG